MLIETGLYIPNEADGLAAQPERPITVIAPFTWMRIDRYFAMSGLLEYSWQVPGPDGIATLLVPIPPHLAAPREPFNTSFEMLGIATPQGVDYENHSERVYTIGAESAGRRVMMTIKNANAASEQPVIYLVRFSGMLPLWVG